MNVVQIIQQANLIADETITTDKAIGFVNDAVARINVKCGANFPFFNMNELNTEYAGFTETWQRALLVPFVVGRIKQTDSSQFEYSDAYGEFQDNLTEFKSRYTIPAQYKASDIQTSFAPDYTGNYYSWSGNEPEINFPPPTTSTDTGVDGGEV
jgi:hypothetical protein